MAAGHFFLSCANTVVGESGIEDVVKSVLIALLGRVSLFLQLCGVSDSSHR